jgi:hypothetical protein
MKNERISTLTPTVTISFGNPSCDIPEKLPNEFPKTMTKLISIVERIALPRSPRFSK